LRSAKLTVVLLSACLLESLLANCQRGPLITLTEKNVPLRKALDDIGQQTGFSFFGEGDWPKAAHPVSFSVTKVSLADVLDICFTDQPLVYSVDFQQHNIRVDFRPREERLIHGWVYDENKEPLGGVVVSARGEGGTLTGDNGEFSVHTHYAQVRLHVSSVAYETLDTLLPEEGKDMTIILRPEVTSLSEAVVVHTGYQDVKRNESTGSFDEVDNDLFNRRVDPNVLNHIDGVTSSVLFNKNVVPGTNQSAITIRGRSTIFGNPNPLVVIDGFPYNGDINNINPADVESITVMKDAASAGIWGAFSGNGVIVITSKTGKFSQEPHFSFTGSVTAGAKPNLHYLPILSSSDYIDIEENLFQQGFYQQYATNPQYAYTPVVALLNQVQSGMLDSATAYTQINALRHVDTRSDLDKYFYRPSLNSQYALSVGGGDAKNQYYLSAGYDQNLSNLVRDQYKRVTLYGNNTHQLKPKGLELLTGFAFTSSTTYNNNTGTSGVIYPYAQLADGLGNALSVTTGLNATYVDTAGGGNLLDWHERPLDELRNADNVLHLTDYRINLGLRYKLFKGLEARAYYQLGKGDSDIVIYNSLATYFTRNLVNLYTQVNNGMYAFPIPRGGIREEFVNTYTANNGRLQLSYTDSLFRYGRLDLLGGTEIRDLEGNSNTTYLYGYNPELGTSMPVDYIDNFVSYTTGQQIQIPYQDVQAGTSQRYLSFYGNAAFAYEGRYLANASARRDESNLFGVQANQKGVPLWSGGFAWELSKERFYGLSRPLPYLKLRLTEGYNGNIDHDVAAQTTATVNNGVSQFYGLVNASIVNPPNPTLRWERINILNAALDFATAGNHFGGTIEYYLKTGLDLIGYSPIDPTTGVSVFEGNTANMRAHGLDVTLQANNPLGRVNWNSVLLFSLEQDKVTKYQHTPGPVIDYVNPTLINPLAGHPLYSVYAARWMGLDDSGNPQGLYGGKVSEDYTDLMNSDSLTNLRYKGPVNPTVFGSWRNSFSWKQWGLSVNIVYKLGYVFQRSSIFYYQVYNGTSPGHPDYERRWQKPGDEKITNVPAMENPVNQNSQSYQYRDLFYQFSDVLTVRGDHVRLQDAQLSYDLAMPAHRRLPVQGIRLYLYANNLGIIWRANHEQIDPDYTNSIPPPRTLALGLKVDY
jgi:TonB-linked SusC/RagA family outer membrane protein